MNITPDKIREDLKNIIKNISPSVWSEDDTLLQDLTSFELIELLVAIESKFEITVDEKDFNSENFNDLGLLVKMITGYLK